VGSVFYLAAGNLVVLAGGQLLMGMGHTVLWMRAQATVIQIGTDSERDRNLGIFGFGTGLGQLSGPLLGGWLLDISGFHGVFLASLLGSAVTLLLIILLPATRRASGGAGESAQSGRGGEEADSKSTLLTGLALLRNGGMQVVITGSFISLFVTSAKQSFFPVWLESVGMTGVQIGMVTSVAGLASLAVRPMLPVLVRLLTRRGVLMGSLMLGITSIAVIPLFTSVWGLGAVSMAMGLACGLNQPMSLTLIANAVSDAQRGSAMGLRLLANRVAHVINPALMGVVVSAAGLAYGFWANAGFLVLALAFLHQRVVSHGFDHSLKQPGAVGGARGSG
ncbi:MAG: MFS transporter, partial [Bacillota bacterium]